MPTADNYKPAGQASSVHREGWSLSQAWTPDLLHTPSVCCGLWEVQDGSQRAVRQLRESTEWGEGRVEGDGWGTAGGWGMVKEDGAVLTGVSLCWHSFSVHFGPIRTQKEPLEKSEWKSQREPLLWLFGYLLSLYQHSLGGKWRPLSAIVYNESPLSELDHLLKYPSLSVSLSYISRSLFCSSSSIVLKSWSHIYCCFKGMKIISENYHYNGVHMILTHKNFTLF